MGVEIDSCQVCCLDQWIKVVQLHVRSNYGIDDFDETLRGILTRCVHGEKICFIIDESSILEASFIERMNTLLANAEIPGLFEGDDYTSLMSKCLELSHAQGLLLDTDAELAIGSLNKFQKLACCVQY